MNEFEKRIRVDLSKCKKEKNLSVLAYEKYDTETKINPKYLGPGGVLGTDFKERKGGIEHE